MLNYPKKEPIICFFESFFVNLHDSKSINLSPIMPIEIRRVENKHDLKTFIDFHYDLYAGSPYDAPALYIDEFNTLNRKKNPAFEFCEAEYFMAYKDGRLAGRVAAIINHKANQKWQKKDVRFGWIDFVDDIEVTRALMKAVEDWGRLKGMDSVVGPLGFTDMDPEGMLTMGFDKLGTMATIYNYDYYPKHMEQLGGWAKDNDYVEYFMQVPETIPDKYIKIAKLVEKRYNLHVKKLTYADVYLRGYGQRVFQIINETYKDLYGYSELSPRQISLYINTYLPLGDLSLMSVIEDANDNNRMVGFGITIPSLSRAMQKCRKGRLLPFGWWHIVRATKMHKSEGLDMYLVGVLPEYRAKGANALLFADIIPRCIKYGFKWGETQVEMEGNNNVQTQWEPLNPVNHKRRRCYRKAIGKA